MTGEVLPVVVQIPLFISMICAFLWAAGEVMRRSFARGTRGRYVWASVERACRWPGIAFLAFSAVLNATVFDDLLMFMFNGVGIALHVVLLQEKKRNGEDDDFWTGAGDKIRGFLTGDKLATTAN